MATEVFAIPSNDNIRKFIRRLITRLESSPTPTTSADTSDSSQNATSPESQQETADIAAEEPSVQ